MVQMGLGKTLCVISLIMADIAEQKRPPQVESGDGGGETGGGAMMVTSSSASGLDHNDAEPTAVDEKGKEKEKEIETETETETNSETETKSEAQNGHHQQQQQLEDSDDVVEVIEEEVDEDLIIFSPPNKRSRRDGAESTEFAADAHRAGREKPTATLIVCPLSIMSNWEQQISQHVDQDWMQAKYTHDTHTTRHNTTHTHHRTRTPHHATRTHAHTTARTHAALRLGVVV
jgi:SWI/SNF-related matrix-associated actin-dependent regulator of chromatin subfamily A3